MPSYDPSLLSPDEEIVMEFRPHWIRVLKELVILLLAIIGSSLLMVVLRVEPRYEWLGLAVVVGFAVLWTIPNIVRWRFSEYILTNERVITRSGVFSRTGKEVPLEVIVDVAFTQSIFERLFGTGDVMIESAGETGQNRLTDIPRPEQFQTRVYNLREERALHFERGGADVAEGKTNAEQLQILSQLHDQGKLSDDEFEAEKRKLLRPTDKD